MNLRRLALRSSGVVLVFAATVSLFIAALQAGK
jgi:preprotein translocase subunit SecE